MGDGANLLRTCLLQKFHVQLEVLSADHNQEKVGFHANCSHVSLDEQRSVQLNSFWVFPLQHCPTIVYFPIGEAEEGKHIFSPSCCPAK